VKGPDLGVIWENHPSSSSEIRTQLRDVVTSHKGKSFAYSVQDQGTYKGEVGDFGIKLHHNHPIMSARRKRSTLEQQIQDDKCAELREAGLITPSPPGTKYASECVLPVKKDADGNYTDRRFCVDFREINSATEADKYGMHRPDEIFREISGHKYFTKMDLRSGFHQIKVAIQDQPKTSFWWKNQLWMYTRMPFGARNATAHFQRVVDAEISKAGLNNNVSSFVDDILIYSKTVEEHVQLLNQTLKMLAGCGLKAHPDKTVICASTVEFLGHNVSADGLTPNEAKVAAIRALQPPTTISQLRSLLGFIGYYRCYIPNFSKIAAPLNQLLRKNVTWHWDAEQHSAFEALKAEVCTPGKVLRHQDPHKPLILHTDWSKEGIGAVLGQVDDQGNEYMVACISRSLNVHERNYSSPQGEMLAAVWAVKTFHTYLHGSEFTLVTDHQALSFLLTNNTLVSMLARWAIILQQYTFTVVHRPGAHHQNADCLSRMPQASNVDTSGARLHNEHQDALKCTLTVQLDVVHSMATTHVLQVLQTLPAKAAMSDTYSPSDWDMVFNASDVQEHAVIIPCFSTHVQHPTLSPPNLRIDSCVDAACQGGVLPSLSASFLACNTTQLPLPTKQQAQAQAAEVTEQYHSTNATSPADVWVDMPVMHYIIQGSVPEDMPAHEKQRIQRRARVYKYEAGVLYRAVTQDDGRTDFKVVPHPDKRTDLVKQAHEQHGHFGVKRTTALLLPYYWWAGLGQHVKHFVKRCTLCDRVNNAFNASAPQLQPLPVQGIFYRWGVDLAGPFNPMSLSGHKFVMILVEHFTKFVDAVAIPDKSAVTTAQVFLERVLCQFGNCAEVVTDGGSEFAGEFSDLLHKNLIDHRTTAPNHPQADGLAERAVQTVKRSLRKICEASATPALWDKFLPWILLGYNCSTQSSTKMSPYYMLHARHPVIPPAHVHRFENALDLYNVEAASRDVLARAQAAEKIGIIAGENLRIAQHRDTLRYATIRSGGYLPSIKQFDVGDFVYLRHRVMDSTLQIPAKKGIYRVKKVNPNGAVLLQGKCGSTLTNNVSNLAPCHLPDIDPALDPSLARPDKNLACEVCAFMDEEDKMLLCDGCGTGWHTMCLQPPLTSIPRGDWLCPRCVHDGVSLADLRMARARAQPTAGPVLRGKPVPLFRDATARRRMQELKALEGRTVAHKEKRGGRTKAKLGTVSYLGVGIRDRCFKINFDDGSHAQFTANEVRDKLMPV